MESTDPREAVDYYCGSLPGLMADESIDLTFERCENGEITVTLINHRYLKEWFQGSAELCAAYLDGVDSAFRIASSMR
jgi:hypothetical protein